MKNQRAKKVISYILLILYVLFLYKTFVLSDSIIAREGTGFTILHLYDEFMQYQLNTLHLYDIIFKVVLMIPFGVLFPTAKQKKCFSPTLTGGGVLGFVCEILQLISQRGTACFDDILLAVFGTYIGYKLFLWLCRKASDGSRYLFTYDNIRNKDWLKYLFLFFAFFYIANIVTSEELTSALNTTNSSDLQMSYREEVYQKIYTELAAHETSVSFFNTIVDGDVISEQFTKVVMEHPELFWLTGGGEGRGVRSTVMTTYHFYPDIAGDINDIPAMEATLNHTVDEIVSAANQLNSDYEKALFVHDFIVTNCKYDMNTYFTSAFSQNSQNFSHAYSAYGCLVNRTAVCSGYARAYLLLMNRLGIECGFVTGIGTNDSTSGDHAWNYIKLDGDYYFVDVTWDDPIMLGGTSNDIRRDYFCITTSELLQDHTIDEGQNVPYCSGTKY